MAILVTLVCENSCNKAVTEAESNASILNSSVSVTFLLISYGLRENWRQRTAINLKKKKRDVCIASERRVNSRVKIKTQTTSTLSSTSIPGRGKEERAWNRGYVQVVCRMRPQELFFITSVKLICHVSKTFLAASRFHSTFKSLDLSAHRLYKSCGPVKTRIVCKAFALRYKETMQLWVVNSKENQNV